MDEDDVIDPPDFPEEEPEALLESGDEEEDILNMIKKIYYIYIHAIIVHKNGQINKYKFEFI